MFVAQFFAASALAIGLTREAALHVHRKWSHGKLEKALAEIQAFRGSHLSLVHHVTSLLRSQPNLLVLELSALDELCRCLSVSSTISTETHCDMIVSSAETILHHCMIEEELANAREVRLVAAAVREWLALRRPFLDLWQALSKTETYNPIFMSPLTPTNLRTAILKQFPDCLWRSVAFARQVNADADSLDHALRGVEGCMGPPSAPSNHWFHSRVLFAQQQFDRLKQLVVAVVSSPDYDVHLKLELEDSRQAEKIAMEKRMIEDRAKQAEALLAVERSRLQEEKNAQFALNAKIEALEKRVKQLESAALKESRTSLAISQPSSSSLNYGLRPSAPPL
mmetsp:Transcript_43337/g.70327  ORF Transcript_43337/g.70327 Transcript_43337/m.70327 type:complete len:338 (+) Transcript_43337:122-1135(+)